MIYFWIGSGIGAILVALGLKNAEETTAEGTRDAMKKLGQAAGFALIAGTAILIFKNKK